MSKKNRTAALVVLGLVGVLLIGTLTPVGAAAGDFFTLGQANKSNSNTFLKGKTTVGLKIKTWDPNGVALSLIVKSGQPPMKVNSEVMVENLNADLLDGNEATAFLGATAKAADSNLLDGLDSTAFVLAATAITGPTLVQWAATPGSAVGVAQTLVTLGGLEIRANCVDNPAGTKTLTIDYRYNVTTGTLVGPTTNGAAFGAQAIGAAWITYRTVSSAADTHEIWDVLNGAGTITYPLTAVAKTTTGISTLVGIATDGFTWGVFADPTTNDCFVTREPFSLTSIG